jgi:hypothetical protein
MLETSRVNGNTINGFGPPTERFNMKGVQQKYACALVFFDAVPANVSLAQGRSWHPASSRSRMAANNVPVV